MYLSNKYTAWYYTIINRALLRTEIHEYCETHHIIPKSLGGTNIKTNLVVLTAREHFICHLLLPKMLDNQEDINKMKYAFHCITHVRNSGQSQRHICTSTQYALAKKYKSECLKGKPAYNKGVPCSDEQKLKISKALKGRPSYVRTQETLDKLSKASKGHSRNKGRASNRKGIQMSEAQKEKIRVSMMGKIPSEESLRKRSNAMKEMWRKKKNV